MPRSVTGEASPGAGVTRAMVLGALVFVVVALFAAVIAFASFFTGDADIVDVAKGSGALFFGFHHVGLRADFPTFNLQDFPGLEGAATPGLPVGPIDLTYTVAIALMLGTLLAIVLLYRAGRRAADEGGGPMGMQILQGAAVAIPYALLSLLLSFAIRFSFELPADAAVFFGPSGTVDVQPSLLSALLWPLGIAALAGGLGGLTAARVGLTSEASRRASAMIGGGGRMLFAVLLAGFVGLLVLGALSPDLTSAYFDAVTTQGRQGLALLLFTILAVPNMAVWGLTIGMGGSIVAGDYLGTSSVTIASLFEFPTSLDPSIAAGGPLAGPQAIPQLPTDMAPIGYFVFPILAFVALLVGGRIAARRAGVVSTGEGVMVGAGAGVVFALAFLVALVLAGLGADASIAVGGLDQSGLFRIGPSLLTSALLGLVWGVVAGAIGGATGTGAELPAPRRRLPTPAPPGPGPEATQELPPEPAAAPTAGTGFEGMAARRAAVAPPELEPELEPEPEPEAEPDRTAPTEPPPPPPPPPPSEPASEGPPAFEFTTPQAQWGGPPEAPPQEEPGPPPPEEEPPRPVAEPWVMPGEPESEDEEEDEEGPTSR